ncbi:YncE family protein [Streptomyces erythrochromogenes]|uniref:YncE family protein n=1 Tax=Streptomyces erythrochromogenes TaxID=285574 RepID=UPI0034356CA9
MRVSIRSAALVCGVSMAFVSAAPVCSAAAASDLVRSARPSPSCSGDLRGPELTGQAAPPPLPQGEYAFVVNSDNPQGTDSSLVILDRRTDTVVKTVSKGLGRLPNAIAVQRSGATSYIANFADASVSVVDTRTAAVTATVPVGEQPAQVALSADGCRAYVVNTGDISTAGGVSVIDTATNRVTDTLTVGFNPLRIELAPDGRSAYAVTDNTLVRIDLRTGQTVGTVRNPNTGGLLVGLALTPDGTRAYAVDSAAGRVLAVDTRTMTLTGGPIDLPGIGLAGNAAVSPDGRLLYVTESASNDVAVVDTATATARPGTITVGRNPTNVAFTPDSGHAYVTSSLDDPKGLSVVNTATSKVEARLNTGSGPFDVALVTVGEGSGSRGEHPRP